MSKLFNDTLTQMILSAIKADNGLSVSGGTEVAKLVEQIASAVDSTKRPCKGITHSNCYYLNQCGNICNKCGEVHDGRPNATKVVDNKPLMHIGV